MFMLNCKKLMGYRFKYMNYTSIKCAGAPSHWRQRRESGSPGAFHGLSIVIVGNPPSPLDAHKLTLMIRAGGGRVERKSSSPAINLAIVCPSKSNSDKAVTYLLEKGIPCASPQYIVDWVAHPSRSLDHYLMFGTCATPSLVALQRGRGVGNNDDGDENVSEAF